MRSVVLSHLLATAGIAFGLFGAASVAQARTDVHVSIGMPGVYAAPAPVYVQPAPVYVQPRSVYVQPQSVYVGPQSVYVTPAPIYGRSYSWEQERAWRHEQWRRRHWREREWEREHHGHRD